MTANLRFLELENFKSYRGTSRIGPIESFTAFIGMNGSGKTNLLEAVGFVLGGTKVNMRIKKYSDLIARASDGTLFANIALVRALLFFEDGRTLVLERAVDARSHSHYELNGESVSKEAYHATLDSLNINSFTRNYLMTNSQISNYFTISSKELRKMLEYLCGSISLEDEYKKCKEELSEVDSAHVTVTKFSRLCNRSFRNYKAKEVESKVYGELEKRLQEDQVNVYLLCLYRIDKEYVQIEEELKFYKDLIQEFESKKRAAVETLNSDKLKYDQMFLSIAEIEQQRNSISAELNQRLLKASRIEGELEGAEKKLSNIEMRRKSVEREFEEHEQTNRRLQNDLREATAALDAHKRTANKIRTGHSEIVLTDNQVQNYNALKRKAAQKYPDVLSKLISKKREIQIKQDKLHDEEQGSQEIKNCIRLKASKLSSMNERKKVLNKVIAEYEAEYTKYLFLYNQKMSENETYKKELEELNKKLKKVTKEINETHLSNQEAARAKKKVEVLETLKREIGGIHGRLRDICSVSDERYQLAFYKTLMPYLNHIVVDSNEVAVKAIKYLRVNMLTIESFLPLDSLNCRAIERVMRNPLPKGSRFLFDVIQYPPMMRPAVLFASRGAVLVQTEDQALAMSFTGRKNELLNSVTLDGIFYSKEGLISGGTAHIREVSLGINHDAAHVLQVNKINTMDEIRKIEKLMRENDVATINIKVQELSKRLEYMKKDLEVSVRETETAKMDLEDLMASFEAVNEKLKHNLKSMKKLEDEKLIYEQKINRIDDAIFETFCGEVGISNIRELENPELMADQKFLEKKQQIEDQIDRINTMISHNKSQDLNKRRENLQKDEERCKENIERLKQLAKKQNEVVRDAQSAKQSLIVDLNARHEEAVAMNIQCEQMLTESKLKIAEIDKHLKEELANEESGRENRLKELLDMKRNILKSAKFENVEIPIIDGDVEELISLSQDSCDEIISGLKPNYELIPENVRMLSGNDLHSYIEGVNSDYTSEYKKINELSPPPKDLENLVVTSKLQKEACKDSLKKVVVEQRKKRQSFEIVRNKRSRLFEDCFNYTRVKFDELYKKITLSQNAQALMMSENSEEPYLSGINLYCEVPGKRFRSTNQLSGGENAVLSTALMMAMYSYKRTPLFVADELDGSLDPKNLNLIGNFLREMSREIQIMTSSHRFEFVVKADNVCIIFRKPINTDIFGVDLTSDTEAFHDITDMHESLDENTLEDLPGPSARSSFKRKREEGRSESESDDIAKLRTYISEHMTIQDSDADESNLHPRDEDSQMFDESAPIAHISHCESRKKKRPE